MTPLLRILEAWLPPPAARIALAAIYAAMLFVIVTLAGYHSTTPIIYLDMH
jgi:hypothetical protein